MSVLSLPSTPPAASAPAFAPGTRKLAVARRPADRATLAHHLAILPLPARSLALVTGNAPGELPADAVLVRWVAARLRALATHLAAGETSVVTYRKEASGLVGLGADSAPAGEELLVGLVAAARRLSASRLLPEPGVVALQASLAGLAGDGAPRETTRLLDDAARGGFPPLVAALVELVGDAEAEDGAVKEAAVRLSANGARPGADAFAGVVAIVRDVALGGL